MQTSQSRSDSSQTTWRSLHDLGAKREREKGKIKGIDLGGELRKWGACKEKTHRNSRRNQIERRRGQSYSKQEKRRRPRRTVTQSRRVVWQRRRQREKWWMFGEKRKWRDEWIINEDSGRTCLDVISGGRCYFGLSGKLWVWNTRKHGSPALNM